MKRLSVAFVVILVAISACAGSIWARGAGSETTDVAVGQVLLISRIQGLLELSDRNLLWTPDIRQLDGLSEGMTLRVRFESGGGRKRILRIEQLGQ